MIERVEVSAVGPDVELQSWASELPPQNATLTIVRVFDEDGTQGVGATPSYSTGRFDRAMLESLRLVAPLVIGKDAGLRESIWHGLDDLTLPVLPGARSALDIALWDLMGKAARQPCYRLMGGRTKARIPVYASRLYSTPLDELAAEARRYKAEGYRAMKLRFGWGPIDGAEGMARNVDLLRMVRDAVGDEVDVMADGITYHAQHST